MPVGGVPHIWNMFGGRGHRILLVSFEWCVSYDGTEKVHKIRGNFWGSILGVPHFAQRIITIRYRFT